jgi:hypothetical protein
MKAYGGSGCIDKHFLDLALAGVEWSASRPCRFTPGKRAPGTPWIGGWVDPRAGLGEVENISDYRDSKPDPSVVQPVANSYVYRLLYPSPHEKKK